MSNQAKLLILGDSLSAGYGLVPQSGWVALLEQRIKDQGLAVSVENRSVSGSTTADGLSKLPNLLTTLHPRWLILALGSNDGLRGYAIQDMKNNLQNMIDLAQKQKTQVILIGFAMPPNYGSDFSEAFKAVFAKLADENQLPFVPFLLEGATNGRYRQPDNLHPNEDAQPIILDNVWSVLEPHLKH